MTNPSDDRSSFFEKLGDEFDAASRRPNLDRLMSMTDRWHRPLRAVAAVALGLGLGGAIAEAAEPSIEQNNEAVTSDEETPWSTAITAAGLLLLTTSALFEYEPRPASVPVQRPNNRD